MLAGEGFFVSVGVASFDGVGDQRGCDAFLLEILADATRAELLIFFAKAGVGFGIGPIVKITLLFEPRYDGVDDGFAAVAGLDAGLHQAPELGFRAHCAAQGADGIAVEADLVEDWTRPGGFAREGQRISPGCGFGFAVDLRSASDAVKASMSFLRRDVMGADMQPIGCGWYPRGDSVKRFSIFNGLAQVHRCKILLPLDLSAESSR